MVTERSGEGLAVVVIAWDEVHGHGERRQQAAQAAVLVGGARVDEVGGQHDVGARPQAAQMLAARTR